jgi:mRNA interferase RelE/StbE
MAEYEIFFKESVWKDFKKIPKNEVKKIFEKIKKLGDNPRSMGCEKLSDQELYRIRHGRYRIVFSIQDTELTIWVIKVGHRKDIYR